MDIGPYMDCVHPDRHFAYFAMNVTLAGNSEVKIKALYDWDKKVKFYVQEQEIAVADFWRGSFKSFEMYALHAFLYDLDGALIDSLIIAQVLKP
jgi:hypothetical protein